MEVAVNMVCLLVVMAVTYLIGHALLAFTSQKEWQRATLLFAKMALGTIVIITLYALYTTNGRSVTAGIVPLIAGLLWKQKASLNHFKTNFAAVEWKLLLYLSAVTLVFLAIQRYVIIGSAIHPDYSFYAGVGSYMKQSGIESFNMDWVNPEFQSPQLYHYGLIWLSVALGQLCGVTILHSFTLLAIPLMVAVFYAGMAVIIARWTQPVYKAYLYCLLIPCMALMAYYSLNGFSFAGQNAVWLGSLYIQKFLVIAIALISFIIGKELVAKTFGLCLAALLLSSAAPQLLLGLLVCYAIIILRKKTEPGFWLSVLCVVYTLAFILVFYTLTAVHNPYTKESQTLFDTLLSNLRQPEQWPTLLKSIAQRTLDVVINFIPYLCLVLLWSKPHRKEMWRGLKENWMSAIVVVVAIVISASLWNVADNVMIVTSISLPLSLIACSLLMIYSLQQLRGWRIAFPLLLLIGSLWLINNGIKARSLDEKFYTEAKKVIQQSGNYAFVQSGRSLKGSTHLLRNANYIPVLADIRRYTDNYLPVNITVYEIPYVPEEIIDATYVVGALEQSPFLRYTEKNGLGSQINEAQNRFIRENKIRFLVIQRGLNWLEGRPFNVERVITSTTEPFDLYVIKPK